MRYWKKLTLAVIFGLTFHSFSYAQKLRVDTVTYGAANSTDEMKLRAINDQVDYWVRSDYMGLVGVLSNELRNPGSDIIAVNYELATIYSNYLFDIERGIEFDGRVLELIRTDMLRPTIPAVSGSTFVSSSDYFDRFVAISSKDVESESSARLESNRALLSGSKPILAHQTGREALLSMLDAIKADLNHSTRDIPSSVRNRLLTRLIRAEYELVRFGVPPEEGLRTIRNGFRAFDFDEIDYLRLSEYLVSCYRSSGDIEFLELALKTVYLPYVNIRSASARWKYNKLVNEYITNLIEANFLRGRFDEALYYISLNKSRMLLEERLTYSGSKDAVKRITDLVVDDSIPRINGLPDKAWFAKKLASTSEYLDFYVGGAYVPETRTELRHNKLAAASVMPLSSRNATGIVTNEPTETFADDSLYVIKVSDGKVSAVRTMGTQLHELRSQMEKSYLDISHQESASVVPAFTRLIAPLGVSSSVTVSPDKWTTAQPLDYFLNSRVVRSVNFFTAGDTGKLTGLRVAGFFNPTLDLLGADSEADMIKVVVPQAGVSRRTDATKEALTSVNDANVLHLSMHGYFNVADPTRSKLLFAGARKDDSADDPNALYASDMAKISTLRDRDLIFAAACQTGLSSADRNNESELTGILRPLTANRNRNVILSLWNVSDEVTGEFVKAFYARLASSKDVKDAFYVAQDDVRSRHPHPYFWASFYLSQTN